MVRTRRSAAVPAAGHPSLLALDEDAQVEVLHAANAASTLAALASSSKQLCCLARSRVPVKLQVTTPAHAELLIRSHAAGRAPFNACTELRVKVDGLASCLIGAGVFSAAQQWTALQHVDLYIQLTAEQLQPNQNLDYCSAGLLASLPSLKHLRHLVLSVPECGSCSAAQVGQLVQLTRLELRHTQSPAASAAPAAASDAPAAAAAAADLSALSGMTSLLELALWPPPAVQAAAGAAGPFCFPSSLTLLGISDMVSGTTPAAIPRCLSHLPGCPALQVLEISYNQWQHASAHPRVLVGLLAQHNKQLRRLELTANEMHGVSWGAVVPGLPAAAAEGPVDQEWYPDVCLASLRGLECLIAGRLLQIREEEDWQHLAQLTALSKLEVSWVTCPPAPGVTLCALVELKCSDVQLGGHDLGSLLLACPRLQRAKVCLDGAEPQDPVPPGGERLTAHPSLQSLKLELCTAWSLEAQDHMAALVPVLGGVSWLMLESWPPGDTGQPRAGLPDLSHCTAVTRLEFLCAEDFVEDDGLIETEQEDFVAMLAPLVQLRRLEVHWAPDLEAGVALVLQHSLPQLQELRLWCCGDHGQWPSAAARGRRQEELAAVKQQLRDGLQLLVSWMGTADC